MRLASSQVDLHVAATGAELLSSPAMREIRYKATLLSGFETSKDAVFGSSFRTEVTVSPPAREETETGDKDLPFQ